MPKQLANQQQSHHHKAITPLGQAAAAEPPPASVTAKPPPGTAGRGWQAPAKGKAPPTVAEREQPAAPRSPPLFAVDWSRFTAREAFLSKTSEVYKLDPNSAEGCNCHVSSYYYVSSEWGASHPQSYSSIMLKNNSRQSHRCFTTCVHCRSNHPEYADHKTVEEGIVHWWKFHCHPACWVWCNKATEFGITTPETCKAVIGIDLSDQPLPIGAAFHLLPNALPSHPKGLDKRLFKPPYSKTLTPPSHPSEVGLPWLAHQEQLAKAPEKELTPWGWDLFFSSVLEGNSDVLAFLIHPFAGLSDYIKSRHKWHAQAITSVGCQEVKNHHIDVEQHSFMLVLLKVLATKAESYLMQGSQIEQVTTYLKTYEATFADSAQETLAKVQLGGRDKEYVSAVKTYAMSAHKLLTPVNIWMIPYPTGHALFSHRLTS